MQKSQAGAVGGKAQSLLFLQKKGFAVPAFGSINADAVNSMLAHAGVAKDVELLLQPGYNARDQLQSIRERLATADLSEFLERSIIPVVQQLSAPRLIVRSSALCEDGAEHSFAGMFESAQCSKDPGQLQNAVRTVIMGSFSERLHCYLGTRNLTQWPRLAIIIQEYVPGEISGVMFTSFRQGGDVGTLINFAAGSAESVVQGLASDSLFISRSQPAQAGKGLLSAERLQLLRSAATSIEEAFKTPQDVEWTIKDGALHILQSRPITAQPKSVRVWDNSNIAESYTGIVLPLTASFCREVYRVVYIDVARTSGVCEQRIREHEPVFENLLGFFYGRFYYNMLNWYRMLTLFPGYTRNRKNFEHMISAKSRAELDAEYKHNVTTGFRYRYYARNFGRYLAFHGAIAKFQGHVREHNARFRNTDLSRKDEKELLDLYYGLQRDVLSRWSITVDNDFLLMTFFGALKRSVEKNGLGEREALQLVANIRGVVSSDQVAALASVAREFSRHAPLSKLAAQQRYEECYGQILKDNRYEQLKEALNKYRETYGGRFANELRLEKEDIDNSPEYIIKLLSLYSQRTEPAQSAEGPDAILQKLPVLKRQTARHLVKKVKYHVKTREECRLLRAQAFGHVRTIFSTIGRRLADRRILEHWQDIFYLEVREIQRYIEGSSSFGDLQALVRLRKKEYEQYKQVDVDDVFITEGIPYQSYQPRHSFKEPPSTLKGKGCSGGIVSGRIKIMESCDISGLDNHDIIVARHTDPGWTPLFGLCKGIIVEQGGVLSHAAIISRELNLPCVLHVPNATKILKDGQMVTINGLTGEITVQDS